MIIILLYTYSEPIIIIFFEMLSYLISSEKFLLGIIISFLGLNGYDTCQIHAINKCMGSALNPSILDPNCKAFYSTIYYNKFSKYIK